jgi:hypothetical protein
MAGLSGPRRILSRFTEAQIVAIVRESEIEGVTDEQCAEKERYGTIGDDLVEREAQRLDSVLPGRLGGDEEARIGTKRNEYTCFARVSPEGSRRLVVARRDSRGYSWATV